MTYDRKIAIEHTSVGLAHARPNKAPELHLKMKFSVVTEVSTFSIITQVSSGLPWQQFYVEAILHVAMLVTCQHFEMVPIFLLVTYNPNTFSRFLVI